MSANSGFFRGSEPGAVIECQEVLDEDAVLEHFGIPGSPTVPREALDGAVLEEEDVAMLLRAGTLGGTSVGKEVYRVKVEGAVEEFVDRFGWGPYPVVLL
ncbi:MAG TPA: hypothetical protein VFW77_01065 [Candidatus Saccharimonadales bacterium]|nr:hypothetical protein [Candidatus Saccharimonadales bacterium]